MVYIDILYPGILFISIISVIEDMYQLINKEGPSVQQARAVRIVGESKENVR
ncbi:Disulfide bond formation protein D [Sesbania bispinosa]|nr:Disulfide bond formation protein D [Sesbania bispinosa]